MIRDFLHVVKSQNDAGAGGFLRIPGIQDSASRSLIISEEYSARFVGPQGIPWGPPASLRVPWDPKWDPEWLMVWALEAELDPRGPRWKVADPLSSPSEKISPRKVSERAFI